MKKLLIYLIPAMFFIACTTEPKMEYPETKKESVKDIYFETEVDDPYRWLEDDNSEETANWVEAQNKVTFDYLNKLPGREKINARLTELWNYPKSTTPFKEAGKYFFFKNDGLQNQNVLFIADNLESDARILLDPNKLSEDGTVALSGTEVSPDGKYLVYQIARSGSDWNEVFVMDIETGELLPDHIEWLKFSGVSWYDNGFFYSAYDAPTEGDELQQSNENHKVMYHKLGTSQEEDKLIYKDPEHPKRLFGLGLTEDKRFMALYKMEASSGAAVSVKDITKEGSDFIPLMESFDNEFSIVDNIEENLYVLTNYQAPKYRLIKINMDSPEEENWEVIIPEKENVLGSVAFVGGEIVADYMKDAHSVVEVYNYDGTFDYEIELPGIGSIGSLSGKKDEAEAFYSYTSFNTPGEIYKYNFDTKETSLHFRPNVKFNPDEYEVNQIFYESKDGTKVPMFLFHKKGIKMNGKNPVLLYAYGGFNISLTPAFSVTRLNFVETGGIFALANLRGGGEYGEKWHKAGTKFQKQNVFDDFIGAAEYLVSNNYTNPSKLAIMGGSNGGLLVGAVANQRPELFKVAMPAVGVMDMLRYHKFTIGWAWAGDYGTSEDSKEMFEYLYNYSPYHAIIDGGKYPAVLATTADHDDRVVPAHTFKYMARLQELNAGDLPVLIRIETKAGHGGGKPTEKIIEEYTDLWAFTFYHLGMKP